MTVNGHFVKNMIECDDFSSHFQKQEVWYLSLFLWWFQFSWYTRFSAETVFSHKSSSLPAYVNHIVQEKYLKNVLAMVVQFFSLI